ncbi:MAG: sensor histidine kinase [Paracoccaceae bacterium]
MNRKWRPSLALVLGGALMGTLGLSLAGMIALRYLGPEIGFRLAALLLALVITPSTVGLGWLLVRLLLRPIRALEKFAAEQETDTMPTLPLHFGTQELFETGRRVFAMAQALRNREASIRAFTDHVTHELRTPVAAIRAGAELLGDSSALEPGDRAVLAQIASAGEQLESQISAMRDAARARETRYLGRCTLAQVMPALAADWPGVKTVVDGQDLEIPIAPEGLRIVLGHLLRNAEEHGADTVTFRVTTSGEGLALIVQDNGTGVSAGNARRIFDPFFTTRREVGGTGMGLTVVRGILQAHHADIAVEDCAAGTVFRLTFASGRG